MKKIGVVLVAAMVVAAAGFVGCAGTPGAAGPPAPIPAIVVTGTHSAESGTMEFHGFTGGTVLAPIEDGAWTLAVPAGRGIYIPGWDASGGGPFPFIGNTVATGSGSYTITGIMIGTMDIRELLGVDGWQGVLDSPYATSREAALTATDYGIEVTDRTGAHANVTGMRLNARGLANLYAARQ